MGQRKAEGERDARDGVQESQDGDGDEDRDGDGNEEPLKVDGPAKNAQADPTQIGRASCREGV